MDNTFDLTVFHEHETIHLFEPNGHLYDPLNAPQNIIEELKNWASEDQEDNWNFKDAMQGCKVYVSQVSIEQVVEEINKVKYHFLEIEKREDWIDAYELGQTWEEFNKKYLQRTTQFKNELVYSHWNNSKQPITLIEENDDPTFPVIRDGWHRFNFAYARKDKFINAMTLLWLK